MARTIAPDAQEAIATARFIRMSPTKARQVVDLIRGRHVDEARQVLAFTQRGATLPVRKVLESAIANAENNRSLAADELFVARAWVDEGPTLRRFRPRAMGRATRINKRTCHISVVVGRPEEEAPVERPRKKASRRKTSAPPGKKTTERKKTAKKTTANKTTANKTTANKTTANKTAKKTTAKKTTAKKTTKKKPTTKKQEGEST
ncbi:MAG: 50S ribosomal protein L22 [Actinomycetota bacterium]